jgi:hypothetical protein
MKAVFLRLALYRNIADANLKLFLICRSCLDQFESDSGPRSLSGMCSPISEALSYASTLYLPSIRTTIGGPTKSGGCLSQNGMSIQSVEKDWSKIIFIDLRRVGIGQTFLHINDPMTDRKKITINGRQLCEDYISASRLSFLSIPFLQAHLQI